MKYSSSMSLTIIAAIVCASFQEEDVLVSFGKFLFKSISIPIMALLLPLCVHAQEKNLAYYNSHETEVLPDAQAAFKKGEYERTLELCRWHYIIFGDDSASPLRGKSERCLQLTKEMNELLSAVNVEGAQQIARAILLLNPEDEAAKETLSLEIVVSPVPEQDTVKVAPPVETLVVAEQSDVSEPIPSFTPDPVIAPVQSDGINSWFGGIGGGMNFSGDGLNYFDPTRPHGVGTAMDVYVGKWLNKRIGVRVGYQGLNTSNTYVEYGKDPFHYGHADLLFNVRNWFVPYLHYGYLKIDSDGPGGGFGLMLPIHLTMRIAVVPDVKFLVHSCSLLAGSTGGPASTLSATLGFTISLADKRI